MTSALAVAAVAVVLVAAVVPALPSAEAVARKAVVGRWTRKQ